MTRKDFVIIAETIKAEIDDLAYAGLVSPDYETVWHAKTQGVINIAFRFANTLRQTNDRFDRSRFLRAALGDLVNDRGELV